MVKRNKLNLASGILLVIIASVSIIATIVACESLVEVFSAIEILEEEFETLGVSSIASVVLVYGYMIALFLAQSIVYMIFGIKLIKKSKFANSYEKSKSMLIVMLVLVSCSFFFDPIQIFSGLYLATIVLIVCAMSNGKRLDNENLEFLNAQLNIDKDNTNENSNNVENKVVETKEEKKDTVEEKSNGDLMAEKVIALKELKDKGVISNEEFEKMISSCVPKVKDEKEEIIVEKKTTPRPRTKKTEIKEAKTKEIKKTKADTKKENEEK